MTEKNYVVNSKTAKGTIVTVRADTVAELNANLEAFIDGGLAHMITMFETDVITGGNGAPTQTNSALDVITQAFPEAVVVSETPIAQAPAFAPVPPPQAQQVAQPVVGTKTCPHGPMTPRKGMGAKGEWKAYFCPAPKGQQCDPAWLNRSMPEWNNI